MKKTQSSILAHIIIKLSKEIKHLDIVVDNITKMRAYLFRNGFKCLRRINPGEGLPIDNQCSAQVCSQTSGPYLLFNVGHMLL